MSKKHFIAIAKGLWEIEDLTARQRAAEAVAKVLATFSPRFQLDRFIDFAMLGDKLNDEI